MTKRLNWLASTTRQVQELMNDVRTGVTVKDDLIRIGYRIYEKVSPAIVRRHRVTASNEEQAICILQLVVLQTMAMPEEDRRFV